VVGRLLFEAYRAHVPPGRGRALARHPRTPPMTILGEACVDMYSWTRKIIFAPGPGSSGGCALSTAQLWPFSCRPLALTGRLLHTSAGTSQHCTAMATTHESCEWRLGLSGLLGARPWRRRRSLGHWHDCMWTMSQQLRHPSPRRHPSSSPFSPPSSPPPSPCESAAMRAPCRYFSHPTSYLERVPPD